MTTTDPVRTSVSPTSRPASWRDLGSVAIASRLSVAPKTMRNTVSVVLAKIGAEDRAGAVRLARRAGLGSAD